MVDENIEELFSISKPIAKDPRWWKGEPVKFCPIPYPDKNSLVIKSVHNEVLLFRFINVKCVMYLLYYAPSNYNLQL